MSTKTFAAFVLAAAVAAPAFAGNNYWSGGSAFSSNWSDSLNWRNIDGPGTSEKQDVWFEGASARTSTTVNQDYELQSLQFDYDTVHVSSSFTINRSNNARLRVVDGVNNRTSNTQTINVPVIFLSGGQITNSYQGISGGRIYVGDIGTNGQSININPASSGIILNGGIYDNGSVTVDGPGTVSPNAESYWTGGLNIKNGAVSYYASNQLGPDSNKIYFSSSTYSLLSSYVSLTNAHPIEFTSGVGRISTDVGNNTTYSGELSGAGDLAKYGSGVLTLSGTSTRTGRTYVAEGTLKLASGVRLPDTLLDISANASVAYSNSADDRIGSLSGAGTLNLGSNSAFGVGDPGAADGDGTFSGAISGANITFNKQGSGTLNLTGNNAISGYLDMYDGKLLFNNAGAATSAAGSAQTTVFGGTVGGDGSTDGAIDVYANSVVEPSSAIVPGVGLGSLTAGIVALRPGSVAKMEISSGGGNDSLNSKTTMDLYSGTLALSTTFNIAITDSTKHTILHADGARSGIFGTITGMMMSNGRALAVTYDAHNVYVTAAQPGDATLDGKVDFNDLVVLAQNYDAAATGHTWSVGDFNGDGKSEFNDLVTLAQNYGFGASTLNGDLSTLPSDFVADWAIAQSLAPEPATLLGLGAAATWLARRR